MRQPQIGPTLEELLRDPETGPDTHKLLNEMIMGLSSPTRLKLCALMMANPPAPKSSR